MIPNAIYKTESFSSNAYAKAMLE